jgi:SH3-like domain-containing protein
MRERLLLSPCRASRRRRPSRSSPARAACRCRASFHSAPTIQEFENWRKIRDWEGSEGWIHRSLLSGRRTAIVAPWDDRAQFALRSSPSEGAAIAAYLEANMLVAVTACADDWCRLEDDRFAGWIEQNRLWGVYPQEIIEE